MHILHRHIFFSVLATCAAAIGLFTFLIVVADVLTDLLGHVLAGQISAFTFGRLLLLLLPSAATYALPMGILTGVLLVLGRLSNNSEITAMRAAGLSLGYIARPVWGVAALSMAGALGVNFFYMPAASTSYQRIFVDALRSDPLRVLTPRTFVRSFPGVVVYAGAKDGVRVENFWVWELDKNKRVTRMAHARSGRVEFVEEESKLVMVLENVTIESRDEKNPEDFSSPTLISTLDSMPLELQLDNLFGIGGRKQKLKWKTLSELLALRRELIGQGAEKAKVMAVQMTISEKAARAAGVLAFAILTVPLGIRVSRKETSANFVLALVLMLTYYFFDGIIGWLGKYPAVRPDLLIWLPPLGFAVLGVRLFRKLDRN